MQVKKQQLKLDMEQIGSKLGKEYVKAVYCHPACLTYMQKYKHHSKCQAANVNQELPDESSWI